MVEKTQLGVYFFAGSLMNAVWLGGYLGLCRLGGTSLWIPGGVAIAFGSIGVLYCFCQACMYCAGAKPPRIPAGVAFLFTIVYFSATFAGLLGGAYYQQYWQWSDLSIYEGVNVNDLGETKQYGAGLTGIFRFLPEAQVATQYSFSSGDACVAPILQPFDGGQNNVVKFWAVGYGCGRCDPTTYCPSWNLTGSGISPFALPSGYKAAALLSTLQFPQLTNDPNAIYVSWENESQAQSQADQALTIGQYIIGLHFPLWWLWIIPVLVCVIWWS